MTLALITALQHAHPPHSTAPWYIAIPVVAVALGLTIWRWRRGAEAADRLAALVINDEQGAAAPGITGVALCRHSGCDRQAGASRRCLTRRLEDRFAQRVSLPIRR